MPNNYFRFRQFEVRQDAVAMKVCTDACLFGAWLATKMDEPKTVLDIGTGTGLLSLMTAQKTQALIDALDIDAAAAAQAKENFERSPWAGRLNAIHCPVQKYFPAGDAHIDKRYDAIICNPPFFDRDLLSPDERRNLALHHTGLLLHELIECTGRLLADEGFFGIMLPFSRLGFFTALAADAGFFVRDEILVRQTPSHDCFRVFLALSRHMTASPVPLSVTIRDADGQYSERFIDLLRDYYLYLTKLGDEQRDFITR